jgi:hypothetical protein
MKVRMYAVAGVLGIACLVFDVMALGAAGKAHPAVEAQARLESPLAQTYIVLGRYLLGGLGFLQGPADALADASFTAAYPAVAAQPELALDSLYAQARGVTAGVARAAYWGAPILLLAFIVLFTFRPRTVHLIRNSGR